MPSQDELKGLRNDMIIIVVFFTIMIISSTLFLYFSFNKELTMDGNTADIVLKINCSSNSMGLGLRCNDKAYSNKIDEDEKLLEGNVYAFKNSDNDTVVHRLVKDCTKGCYGYIFKGDNNLVADKVLNRSDIKYKIISVKYS